MSPAWLDMLNEEKAVEMTLADDAASNCHRRSPAAFLLLSLGHSLTDVNEDLSGSFLVIFLHLQALR